ncbi:hypothetical protein M8J76_006275 [Diaphorina citri]|nr:hypothetical protein M8J76_006275 [Diaphorina citri]
MIIDGAQGGPNQDTLVTPKRAKKTQEQDDGNVQTNDKSLDEHDLDLDDEGGTYVGEVYIPPIAPVCFADPTGPRLIITKIVAFNFKSYAGYVTLGPFNTRFNAIIGPNGSGKSNVIDSMLFVFGYRASKIRANKLSVLMHKSDQVGGVSRCSVAIHFAQIIDKPNEEYEIIPGTDLEIARTAFYDNSSYYTLNGKKVHFKEVAKVLRDHGVDLLNNRFLILQYLEEIIGTNRYKEPIAKMEVLYGKYDEERTEKLTRVQLVETDLKALEPELRKAVNFLELENCVQRKHNEIYQYERYVNMKNLGEHESKVQQMEQELTENLESIKKCTDEMESAKSELKTVEKEMGSKDSKVAQTEAAIEKAKIMIQKLNAEQKETEKRNTKAKDETYLAHCTSTFRNSFNPFCFFQLKNLQKVPEANKAEIETLEAEKEELGAMKKQREERLQQVMASIASETASLQDKKNELQRVQIELRKGYDEAKSKCDIAKSELEIFLSTQSKETKKLADLEANLEKVQTTLTERKTLCEELTTRVPAMESEIAESRARLADLTREEAKLIDQVEKLAREVSEKRESMQTSRSNNRLIDFVMQLKSENRVSGILGRLGDLGGIDQKYDIAVSTACGALNYIVTETVEAGEAVIAAVKRQNVGRVNVIPLDKMQQYHSQCYDKYRTPENVPRLIDLIQVQDEKIRLAFYFATRETLVAQDLNQAKRIGYSGGGYRMVTLEGAIIEPSGTMSGGGSNPIRGLMGRKATVSTDTSLVKDLEVKEKQLASLETELRILSQQKMEVETQLNCTSNELKYKKQEYDTCLIDVKIWQPVEV